MGECWYRAFGFTPTLAPSRIGASLGVRLGGPNSMVKALPHRLMSLRLLYFENFVHFCDL